MAEGHDDLARAQLVGIAEREYREIPGLDLDDGDVRLEVDTDDGRVDRLLLAERIDGPSTGSAMLTLTRIAPATTWALVTMKPSRSTITPDPDARWAVTRSADFATMPPDAT